MSQNLGKKSSRLVNNFPNTLCLLKQVKMLPPTPRKSNKKLFESCKNCSCVWMGAQWQDCLFVPA